MEGDKLNVKMQLFDMKYECMKGAMKWEMIANEAIQCQRDLETSFQSLVHSQSRFRFLLVLDQSFFRNFSLLQKLNSAKSVPFDQLSTAKVPQVVLYGGSLASVFSHNNVTTIL